MAGALAVLALLAVVAGPAAASPAVEPVSERGKVPAMGLNLVDASALACPEGVTTWSPMILPIEMAPPQGPPNSTIDPTYVKNMPDGSSLWYRTLGSTRSGGKMILDEAWTQDGRTTMPITRTGLRSGTYLLGALCATPGRARLAYPLDAKGNLIGEWWVVTFVWMDSQPEQGTFHFERQVSSTGAEPTATPQTPAPQAAVTAVAQAGQTSAGTGLPSWSGWLGGAAVLVLVTLAGIRFGRHRRQPS